MGGSCRVRLRLGRVLSSPAGGIIQSICYQLEPINTLKVYNKKYKKRFNEPQGIDMVEPSGLVY